MKEICCYGSNRAKLLNNSCALRSVGNSAGAELDGEAAPSVSASRPTSARQQSFQNQKNTLFQWRCNKIDILVFFLLDGAPSKWF
ncbi:MAG: hypothetical protein FJX23_09150 [Alphaproteobacteria bacterium]|nr:hypothetical protein [Alphaproteobacteria bacterium]